MKGDLKKEISILFEVLEKHGVEDIICSPGSRNAPLILNVDKRENFKKYVVVDERMAGFMALGMAMISRKPTVLICTSGTAVLNYAPAVAEAFYQGIPLIVISADRPNEWIDQNDSQTIRQSGFLSKITKAGYDIIAGRNSAQYDWYVNRSANEAVIRAMAEKPGPVHINVSIDPPLDRGGEDYPEERKIEIIEPGGKLDRRTLDMLVERAACKKTLILAGINKPNDKLQKSVIMLSKLPNVCVMAETVSNLHLDPSLFMIDSVLTKLDDGGKEKLKPELLISFGGAIVSKLVKKYLRKYQPEEHWAVGVSDNLIDCYQSLTTKIDIPAESFLPQFAARLTTRNRYIPIRSDFAAEWEKTREKASKANHRYFSSLGWSDFKIFEQILTSLPEKVNLFLSNGTPVRYSQIIPYRMPHATYCNRGVSGIEGTVSTFLGASTKYKGLSLLITGDMSLNYDISALGSSLCGCNLRIIMIENGGGAIFRHIESTRNLEIREKYFCVNQKLPVRIFAESCGWECFDAADSDRLNACLRSFYKPSEHPKLLIVNTEDIDSAKMIRNFLENKI